MAEIANSQITWKTCLDYLAHDPEISEQECNTWLRPLRATYENNTLILSAPNQFVQRHVSDNFLGKINEALAQQLADQPDATLPKVQILVATTRPTDTAIRKAAESRAEPIGNSMAPDHRGAPKITFGKIGATTQSNINPRFTFDTFVEGKSNELARAAALQVSENPGQAYNPLFIYGGVGLGKTHLNHAIGNAILQNNPRAKVLYLHSERFVADMIKALQRNAMNEFKRYYRTANCLLIDDIQFFAGKERSQEEFFHTFNSLLDGQQQIVLTCDRYPKEIKGLEERLQSRFGWGLTIAIEPPELETRVAILMAKAESAKVSLPNDVAFFIAKNIQSNVRELEGALKRVVANAHFTGNEITVPFAREALKDLLTLQAKLITIENIQRTVGEYYKIKVVELLSKRRNRSIARPRQVAMALSKKLTRHSLPEIGDAFGGRDHTTVLHACRKIEELLVSSLDIQEDWKNLLRILSA